jgi:Concanavalin A-like lectin/glucanases superfamily
MGMVSNSVSGLSLTLGEWHHLAWTYNGYSRLLTFYLDGIFNNNRTMNAMITPQTLLGVGGTYRSTSLVNEVNGAIGAVRVQSGLLSLSDVTNNYSVGLLGTVLAQPVSPSVPTGLAGAPGDTEVFLTWNNINVTAGYNVKRSTINGGPYTVIATNIGEIAFTDGGLVNGMTYYYVVSGTNSLGESADSYEVSTRPVSLTPPSLSSMLNGNQLQFNWPGANTGWRLEAQTNSLGAGLGTNWFDVSSSDETNWISMPADSANGSVFFRLVYP